MYLHGNRFTVITDHHAIAWLMKISDQTSRLSRWSIYLQGYDFEIKHHEGSIHNYIDTLSRPVMTATTLRSTQI